MNKSIRIGGVVAAAAVVGTLGFTGIASAHGTGVVSGSGVFAVCSPTSPSPGPCTPGRSVTYSFSNFGAASTLYVWWLDGAEPTNPSKSDCTKGVALTGRTRLGTVSLSGGKGTATYQMPPPAAPWSYGPNWVCATTATDGQTGVVGDQIFTIYPV